jgi:DNA (cytosine-5)-methyltransferase 1
VDYYNEHDKFAAAWLRELIADGQLPPGDVDERDIQDVRPTDLAGYAQCHFFAGIGGWKLALMRAGWPDNRHVWTGSCPCQPFSAAGKRAGTADERHLWPSWFWLIQQCGPATVFGEQVASPDALVWLDIVQPDLEGAGYACGAADLCSASVGAPHIRQRLFWVANATSPPGAEQQREQREVLRRDKGSEDSAERPRPSWMAITNSDDLCGITSAREQQIHEQGSGIDGMGNANGSRENVLASPSGPRDSACEPSPTGGLDDSTSCRHRVVQDSTAKKERSPKGHDETRELPGRPEGSGCWSDYQIIPCLDGKSRRIGSGVFPLAYGIPRDLGRGEPELRGLAKRARSNRVGRLKGYGNAIVPQVAAMFVRAFLDQECV